MSLSDPESSMTTEELAVIGGFSKSRAEALDEAIGDVIDQILAVDAVNDAAIAALDVRIDALEAGGGGGGTDYLVTTAGATGDGVTDDRAAILTAMSAAAAAGKRLFFPNGTYLCGRTGSSAYCLDVPVSNLEIVFAPGAVIKFPSSMPDASVSMFRVDMKTNVTFRNVTIDGNWGNAVTEINETSHRVTLPQATIYVKSTTGFPSSGYVKIVSRTGYETITYTGKTSTTFTGCSGGTATMYRGQAVGYIDPAFAHVDAADNLASLPLGDGILNVDSTTAFNPTGTLYINTVADGVQTLTYTGITSTTFTGVTGGTGTIVTDATIWVATSGGNHSTQLDAKNHGIVLRGAEDIKIIDCKFRDMYGDAIWLGRSSDDDYHKWTKRVRIINCDINVAARNGISFGGASEDVEIAGCTMRNILTCAIDSEPQNFNAGVRNIRIHHNTMAAWWTYPGGGYGQAIGCVGGYPSGNNQSSAARNWRIHDNTIVGWTAINTAIDVVMEKNHITLAHVGSASTNVAPIHVDHTADDITIHDNYIYDDSTISSASGGPHRGSIDIAAYSAGNVNQQPAGVRLLRNKIHARRGVHAIWAAAVGGFSIGDATAIVAPVAGTSTAVGVAALTDSGAAWTPDQWIGWEVVTGGVRGLITGNTSTVLTIATPVLVLAIPDTIGWRTPQGDPASTPSTGTYVITSIAGVLDIDGNEIDCGPDGNAIGGYGIYLFNERSGGRIRVANNKIKNVNGYAVYLNGAASKPVLLCEIIDNKIWDDQPTPTTSAAIRAANAASWTSIVKMIVRGNTLTGGVTTMISGVSSGTWIVTDGAHPDWAGYGAPESVVTAPIGATYTRLDGSAGLVRYVKNSGTGNTGWVAIGGVVATGTITCVTKASMADTDYITVGDGINPPVVYEFDTAGDGVTAGRVQVNISGATTASDVAVILQTAVNANQPVLTVAEASGVLTLTHKIAGTFANVTITENVANAGFLVTGLTGGVNAGR